VIVKVQPNKPLIVNLLYASAIEKQGKYGLQFLYTLDNGDGLFVPPIAHQEIQSLHVGPGEPFTLLKTIGQGNQAVWKVERVIRPDGPENANQNRPAPTSQTSIAPKSITNGKAPVAVMPTAAPTVAPISTPQSKTLLRQLIAAIEVTHAAKIYAKGLGMDIEFTGTDIRALAITGGIQVFKEGVY
jgi:hypothetical protein